MKNIKKPAMIKKLLEQVLDELKASKISKKLVNFVEQIHTPGSHQTFTFVMPKYESLYDYINEEKVSELILEAESLYQVVEVFLCTKPQIVRKLCARNKLCLSH